MMVQNNSKDGPQSNINITYSYPIKPFYTLPQSHRSLTKNMFGFINKNIKNQEIKFNKRRRLLQDTKQIVDLSLLNYILAKQTGNDIKEIVNHWSPIGVTTSTIEENEYTNDYVLNFVLSGPYDTYDLWPEASIFEDIYFELYQVSYTEDKILQFNLGRNNVSVKMTQDYLQVKPVTKKPAYGWLVGKKYMHGKNKTTSITYQSNTYSSITDIVKNPKCSIFVNPFTIPIQ